MQDSGATAVSELCRPKDVETLVVPSDPGIKTFIPFGMDGTSVIISPYGEVLRMSRYLDEDEPRIICLGSPKLEYYHRDLISVGEKLHGLAQAEDTGFHVRLMPASGEETSGMKTRLEWINGHWPCIYYQQDGLDISVLFTMDRGILSQQYLMANPSAEQKSFRFALQIGGAQVNTLHVDGTGWVGANDELSDEIHNLPHTSHAFHVAEKLWDEAPDATQHGSDGAKLSTRGEAVIAVLHNDELLAPENVVQIPVWRNDSDSDGGESDDEQKSGKQVSSASSSLLNVAPSGVQKLVVQYSLRPYGVEDSRALLPQETGTLLKSERSGNWSFVKDDDFNPIYRRHLEYILCLCLISDRPSPEEQSRNPFINDITFESGSTPMNDFYIFRYLLFMYRMLDNDDHIRSPSSSSTLLNDSPTFEKSVPQTRIKEACKGHLRWCFENAFLTSQSWPSTRKPEPDEVKPDSDPKEEAFIGSLQILKLFEFAMVIEGEASLVNECLVKGSRTWLDALIAERDDKSKLWYKDTKREYLEAGHGEGQEFLDLPDYRLGDLIYIWKALRSLEDLACKSDDKTFVSKIREILSDHKLQPHEVRKNILQCFLFQDQVIDKSDTSDTLQAAHESTPDASHFSIAVRRSRNRDRLQFTTKDTMLCDGCEWGFFRNDLDVEVLNTKQELVKANIELSWKKTVKAQSDDGSEEDWEKSLRYALAIIMAKFGSLDSSKSPKELQTVSRKRLVDCIVPCGLFAQERDCDTHLPKSLPVSGSQRSSWEIPTLLSRRQFENLELIWVEDATSSLAINNSTSTRRDTAIGVEQRASQALDESSARDAKIDANKKVGVKKKVGRFYAKIESQMVSDPPERKLKDWLYPLPDFINKRPPYKPMNDEFKQNEDTGLDHHLEMDLIVDQHDSLRQKVKSILSRGLKTWKKDKAEGGKEAFSWGDPSAFVFDVGKRVGKYPGLRSRWLDAEDLDVYLRTPRRVENAKKRFHYTEPLKFEPALIFYLAAPVRDRHDMAQFYVRHSSFSSDFLEHVHDVADVWTTELHLSFLQLVNVQDKPREEASEGESVCNGRQRRFIHRYKGSQYDIYKASLSYRFVGDLGDRFWSGYLLAYLPRRSSTPGSSYDPTNEEYLSLWEDDNVHQWALKEIHNDQRNVFEPFLVDKMVAEVYQSTQKILNSIDDWLELGSDDPKYEKESTYSHISKVDDRNSQAQYSRRTNDCPDLADTLSLMQRLSEANSEVLSKYRVRESARLHKPRWSEKDEGKYRKQVDSRKRLAEQQISLLLNQCGKIQSTLKRINDLKQELVDNLSLFEARRAARQSENIQVFTYATVIFYPLSFIASIFSMQGAPKYDTTIPFLQATAIALIITLLIVFNAGILVWPLGSVSQRFWFRVGDTARSKMENTPNVFPVPWKKVLSHVRQSDGEDVLNESKYIYLMFLVTYWLVEFPALRLVLAYEYVTKNDITTPDRIGLAAGRILIALTLLPLFLAVWTGLVTWSIVHWTAREVWMLPYQAWRSVEEQSDNRSLLEREKRKSDAGDDDKVYRESKKADDEKEKNIQQARKEKEDRVRNQVSLLLNPRELYQHKVGPYNEKLKALALGKKKSLSEKRKNPAAPDQTWPVEPV